MSRHLLLFGNGLGRSIDNDFFQISTAIQNIWENKELFSEIERELISSCIPGLDDPDHPSGEDEMLNSQLAIQAIRQLADVVNARTLNRWITNEAESFGDILEKFVSHVSRYFHNTNVRLPNSFGDPLVDFVNKTRSHVITLNYDPLLYDWFCRKHRRVGFTLHLCNDFKGDLVDGFTQNNGFSRRNFPALRAGSQGYLLHLHGSPIFGELRNRQGQRTEQPEYVKLTREQLRANPSAGRHIVLTHGSQKEAIIQASGILSLFWEKFQDALIDAEKISLFGYSGFDDHLNRLIKRLTDGKPKRIIERDTLHKSKQSRVAFWEERVGENVEVILLDNVLLFTQWEPPDLS